MTCARRQAEARNPAPSAGSSSRPEPRCGLRRARLSLLLPAFALLLCGLHLLAAAPAQAQTVTLVSNTGQTLASTPDFDRTFSQGFTTGPATGVYSLTSIKLWLYNTAAHTAEQMATFRAELWDDATGRPGAKVADLTVSNISTGVGHWQPTLSAPAGTVLKRNTKYHLVVYTLNGLATLAVHDTGSDAQDAGGASGWTIDDGRHEYDRNTPSHTGGSWSYDTKALRIVVAGVLLPPPPGNLAATAGGGKVTLSWSTPSPNSGAVRGRFRYQVEYGEHPSGALTRKLTGTIYSATPSYEIGGLTGGTAYRFRVRSFGSAGAGVLNGAWSDWVTATPLAPPGQPTNLSAVPSTSGVLTVTWTAPSGTLTGYDVGYTASKTIALDAAAGGPASTNWARASRGAESDPPAAQQRITGLSDGTEYRVRVRSKDATGESAWVETTGTPGGLPPPPRDLAVAPGLGKLDLTWTAPEFGTPTDYQVNHTTSTTVAADAATRGDFLFSSGWIAHNPLRTDPIACCAYAAGNLTNGVKYRVRIRAKYGAGAVFSAWAVGAGTPNPPPPTNLTVTPGDGRLDPSWTAPAGVAVQGYFVDYTASQTVGDDVPQAGNPVTGWAAVPPQIGMAAATSRPITGLTNGTEYRVRVRTVAGGAYSAFVFARGTPKEPDPPGVPRNVVATPGNGKLTLTWRAPASWGDWPAGGYVIQENITGLLTDVVSSQFDRNDPTLTSFVYQGAHRNLAVTNGTEYRLRIQAWTQRPGTDGTEESHYLTSEWVEVSGTPTDAPRLTGLSLSAGASAVALRPAFAADTLRYTATVPHDATSVSVRPTWGATVMHVDVGSTRVSDGDILTSRAQNRVSSSGGSATVSLASSGNTRINAHVVENTAESPDFTNYYIIVSRAPHPDAPPVPTGLSVAPGNAFLRLDWTAVSGATGYDVHYTASTSVADDAAVGTTASTEWVAVSRTETSPPAAEDVIPSLTNDTPYRVRVRAKNAHGAGLWAFGSGTPKAGTPTGSTDATLSALAMTNNITSRGAISIGTFSSTTYAYTANVPGRRTAVRVTPTVNQSDATVKVGLGTALTDVASGSESDAIDLAYGANRITVEVTAQAANKRSYTIVVTRALPTAFFGSGAATLISPEEGDSGTLGIALDAPNSTSGTLSYAATGTHPASLTDDVSGLPTAFTTSATEYDKSLTYTVVDDALNEENETFTATIEPGTGYTVGSPATVTITITDNDPPAAPGSFAVTAGNAKLDVSWAKPAGPVTGYQVRHKTTAAADQAATTPGNPTTGWVTTTHGGTGTTATISSLTNTTSYDVQVRATDGQTRTGNGYGPWTATQASTPQAITAPSVPRNVVATPGDGKIALTWQAPASWGTWTARAYEVEWKLSSASDASWALALLTSPTATGYEFTGTNGTAYDLRIRAESQEPGTNNNLQSAWVTVTNQVPFVPTVVTLSAAPNPVPEGGAVTVTATLSAPASGAVTIPVTLTDDPDNPPESGDRGTLSSLTIPAGLTGGAAQIQTYHDAGEDDELFTVALDTANLPSRYVAGSPSSVRIRISDDEGVVRVNLRAQPNPVREGAPVTLEAVLTRGGAAYIPPDAVRIPVSVAPTTAERGDLCRMGDGSFSVDIHIGGGAHQGSTGVRNLPTCHDADREDERFSVAVEAGRLPAGYARGEPSAVSVTIDDDDDGGAPGGRTVTLSAAPNPVPEGGTVTVTATLEINGRPIGSRNTEVIRLRVYGMTSEPGDHGTLSSIRIPFGRTSATATIATRRDADGDAETFAVQLGRLPSHIGPGRCAALRVTIAEPGRVLRADPYACGGGSGGDARLRQLGLQR